ncbi:hypothetical protein [Streptomyces hirsutus]|uniref:hypothetical protein n=1 Tax=Streptomyces hirsutus TaxID=35620 RepID=UPI0036C4F88B
MTAEPLRPGLSSELITLAARRAHHIRNQLNAVHVGQDRHSDHVNAEAHGHRTDIAHARQCSYKTRQ